MSVAASCSRLGKGNLRDLGCTKELQEESRISQDNHVFRKLYYGREIQKNGLQSRQVLKSQQVLKSSPERSEKEDRIAGNNRGIRNIRN